jgi:hypothetical protein
MLKVGSKVSVRSAMTGAVCYVAEVARVSASGRRVVLSCLHLSSPVFWLRGSGVWLESPCSALDDRFSGPVL